MTAVGELVTPTGRLVLPPNADRADWLAARRWRDAVPGGFCIGSSEVPSLLDLDGVDTPVHVFRSKRGDYVTPENEAMIFGRVLEAPVAAEWTRRNRCVTDEIGLVSHAERPWHQSTIDRRVRECPIVDGMRDNCLCEIKCVGYMTASQWRNDLPDRIVAQVIHQLYVTGMDHAHVAMLIGGNTLRQTVVWAAKERELTEYIVKEVDAFRETYLIPGVEPAWNTVDKAAKLIELDSLSHPERVGEIDLDGITDVMEYAEAQAAESAARKRKEQAKARLAQLADGRETVTFSGERAFWYGESEDTRCDLDKLAERYPDAYTDPEVVKRKKKYTIYIDKAYKVRQS